MHFLFQNAKFPDMMRDLEKGRRLKLLVWL